MENVGGSSVANGKKSPIIAALLSSPKSMSTGPGGTNNVNDRDRVVDEEVSKLINNPAGSGQDHSQHHQFAMPTANVGHQYNHGFGPAFPTIPSRSSSSSSLNLNAKSPAGGFINRNLSLDFVSIDRSSVFGSAGPINVESVPSSSPTLPYFGQYSSNRIISGGHSSKSMSMKFPDSPVSLSPLLRRRFMTPSPSPSESSIASTTSNSGSAHRYSRRRHAKKYPPFDVDHCKFKQHFCPEPLAPGTMYCIKHQNCISNHVKNMYERCSFRDLSTGRQCTNFRSSKDSRLHDRLLFCQSHADRLTKVSEEQKRSKLGPLHVHQLIDELRENIDLSSDDKMLRDLTHMPQDQDFLKWWKENEDWLKCAEAPVTEQGHRFVKAGERSINDIIKYQTEPVEDEPDQGFSEGYDVLRNAGFYTTEEIIQIHRSKVVQLQERLEKQSELEKILYKEKKRQYMMKMYEINDPTLGFRYTSNPRCLDKKVKPAYFAQQMETLKKKKVMLRYAKKTGPEKVLYIRGKALYMAKLKEKEKERDNKEFNSTKNETGDDEDSDSDETTTLMELTRRMKSTVFDIPSGTTGVSHPPSKSHQSNVCIFNLGYHKKCGIPVISTTKYCQKHILSDQNQKLFNGCQKIVNVEDGDKCGIPILMVEDSKMCSLHRTPKYNEPSTENREEYKERLKKEANIPEATGQSEEDALLELALADAPDKGAFVKLLEKILEKGLDSIDEPPTSSEDEDEDDDDEIVTNSDKK